MMTNMHNLTNKIISFLKEFRKDPLFLRRWENEWMNDQRQERNRLSVRTASSRRRGTYPYYGTSSMFIEDLYTGVMPFLIYRGEREKYPTTIEPHSREKERLLAAGISGRGHGFLADALCDFVRNAAHTLFQDGVACYEIVYQKNESGETLNFSLEWVRPDYLFRIFNNYYQVIPWWVAKESHLKVQIIKIPKEKILRIDLPKPYGGRRRYLRMLRRIWSLGEQIIPQFQMNAMEQNQQIGFDWKKFQDAKFLEIARLTRCFGWNQRQLSGDTISEYYSLVRYLRLQKTEITARELIIEKLNEILNRQPLRLDVVVAMRNLPSIQTVEEQEKLLNQGDVVFTDVINALKI